MSTQLEAFDWPTVLDLGIFQVDFGQVQRNLVNKKTKEGREYTATTYNIVVRSRLFQNPIILTGVSQKHYDRMRVLRAMGLINLSVTRGIAPINQPASWAPYIIEGAKNE